MNALRKSGSPPPKQMPPPVAKKIKIVHLHVHHQQFRVHLLPYAVGFEALGIEAILAMERASVECHEGGDTLAVYRKAVAVDANEWGGLHFILI